MTTDKEDPMAPALRTERLGKRYRHVPPWQSHETWTGIRKPRWSDPAV